MKMKNDDIIIIKGNKRISILKRYEMHQLE